MHRNLVAKLTLDTSSISFRKNKELLDDMTVLVDDIMFPVQDKNNVFNPDYMVVGNFQRVCGYCKKVFNIRPGGQNILYVTGTPKEAVDKRFRLDGAIFTSFWQDNMFGYLFQVVKNTNNLYWVE